MKKIFLIPLLAVLLFSIAGCTKDKAVSGQQEQTPAPQSTDVAADSTVAADVPEKPEIVTLTVAADAVPHAELLEFVRPKLLEEGIELNLIVITDSTLINEQTDNGEFDVNFFQHEPYLISVATEKGYDLVNGGNIHVEPIGFYSTKYTTKEEIPDNATIAIPNDATNEFRALTILAANGFIKLKDSIDNYSTTIQDVEEYIKPITLVEMDSAMIIRSNDQFDGYITNTNKILEAGIDTNSALFREGKDSPYANILAVKSGRVDDPAIKALYKALTSEDVRKFIEEKYNGAVIPAF